MRVFITEVISPAGTDFLRERGYEYTLGSGIAQDVMIREAAGCQAIIARTANITRPLMEALPELKVVSRLGVGVDNVDLAAAAELGIRVTNGPLSNYVPVAEHTLALMLNCAERLNWMDRNLRAGHWEVRDLALPTELRGKTVGIIGLGRIGRTVAEICALGFQMKVMAWHSHVDPATVPDYITLERSLDTLLAQSDYVNLHCPATPETAHLIGAHALSMMKPTAILINCARGAVVDQQALYEALRDGRIAGAGLDVFDPEPPLPSEPLLQLDNVVLSPHCAALTGEAYARMSLHAAIGVDEVLSGKPVTWPVI